MANAIEKLKGRGQNRIIGFHYKDVTDNQVTSDLQKMSISGEMYHKINCNGVNKMKENDNRFALYFQEDLDQI